MFVVRGLGVGNGLAGEEDRAAAASYCGQKYGATSPETPLCVAWYVNDKPGDYPGAQAASAPTPASTSPSIFAPTSPHVGPTALMPTPWYKTPIGMIAILAGLFAGYKILKK